MAIISSVGFLGKIATEKLLGLTQHSFLMTSKQLITVIKKLQ